MASCLMAVEMSLAIAYCVGFSLTGNQITGVLVTGFLVPVGVGVAIGWGGNDRRGVTGFMLLLSIPLSLAVVVGLLIFGAVTLGSS